MSAPRTVAVIGASGDRRKFGNKAVRAYAASGWRVYPVHPDMATVEGLPAYSALSQVPEPVDTVSVYVPPAVGLSLLPEIASCHPRAVWINPGAESATIQAEVRRLHLPVIFGCSILSLGHSPSEFPADAL
jgi:hypothetical protein